MTTNENGIAVIPYPRYLGPYGKISLLELVCRVSHPDFVDLASANVAVTHAAREKVTTITLHRGAVLSVVASLDGQPLSAENLYVLVSTPSTRLFRKIKVRPGGSLRLPRLPEGLEVVRIVYLPDEGPPMFSDPRRLTLRNRVGFEFQVRMKPSVRVEGQLDDDVPRPVENGRVIGTVVNREGNEFISWWVCAKVNDDGSFILEGVPQGELQVIALCDGFMAKSGETSPEVASDYDLYAAPDDLLRPQVFNVTEKKTSITVEMRPTAGAVIHVQDPEAEPIVGAVVSFNPSIHWWGLGSGIYGKTRWGTAEIVANPSLKEHQRDFRRYRGTTNAKGTAIIKHLPPGEADFSVFHEDFQLPIVQINGRTRIRENSIELTAGKRTETTVTLKPKETRLP